MGSEFNSYFTVFGGTTLLSASLLKLMKLSQSQDIEADKWNKDVLAPVTGELHVVTVKDGQFVSRGKTIRFDTDDALIRKSNLKDQYHLLRKL